VRVPFPSTRNICVFGSSRNIGFLYLSIREKNVLGFTSVGIGIPRNWASS